MTERDNLRDRIADIIERVGNDWDAQMMSAVVDGKSEPPKPLADTTAQAIIDELGLTVETHVDLGALPDHLQGVWMDDPAFREWEAKQPRKTRVVGKWEER